MFHWSVLHVHSERQRSATGKTSRLLGHFTAYPHTSAAKPTCMSQIPQNSQPEKSSSLSSLPGCVPEASLPSAMIPSHEGTGSICSAPTSRTRCGGRLPVSFGHPDNGTLSQRFRTALRMQTAQINASFITPSLVLNLRGFNWFAVNMLPVQSRERTLCVQWCIPVAIHLCFILERPEWRSTRD